MDGVNINVDYKDLRQVKFLALSLFQRNPKFPQYVVKYPNRPNFNITMRLVEAYAAGAELVVAYSLDNN